MKTQSARIIAVSSAVTVITPLSSPMAPAMPWDSTISYGKLVSCVELYISLVGVSWWGLCTL